MTNGVGTGRTIGARTDRECVRTGTTVRAPTGTMYAGPTSTTVDADRADDPNQEKRHG